MGASRWQGARWTRQNRTSAFDSEEGGEPSAEAERAADVRSAARNHCGSASPQGQAMASHRLAPMTPLRRSTLATMVPAWLKVTSAGPEVR